MGYVMTWRLGIICEFDKTPFFLPFTANILDPSMLYQPFSTIRFMSSTRFHLWHFEKTICMAIYTIKQIKKVCLTFRDHYDPHWQLINHKLDSPTHKTKHNCLGHAFVFVAYVLHLSMNLFDTSYEDNDIREKQYLYTIYQARLCYLVKLLLELFSKKTIIVKQRTEESLNSKRYRS